MVDNTYCSRPERFDVFDEEWLRMADLMLADGYLSSQYARAVYQWAAEDTPEPVRPWLVAWLVADDSGWTD